MRKIIQNCPTGSGIEEASKFETSFSWERLHCEDPTFSYDTVLINDQPNHLNQNYRCDCTLLILCEFCGTTAATQVV